MAAGKLGGKCGWQTAYLEGQAERHWRAGLQVVHHQLAALREHNDGCRVLVHPQAAGRRHHGVAVDGAEPRQRLRPRVAVLQQHVTANRCRDSPSNSGCPQQLCFSWRVSSSSMSVSSSSLG